MEVFWINLEKYTGPGHIMSSVTCYHAIFLFKEKLLKTQKTMDRF